jgi:YD repeat-containing protein
MSYDEADGLISLANKAPDTSPIASYQFTLDLTGNITKEIRNEPLSPTRSEISEVYNHGNANELLDHTSTPGEFSTYTHDPDGNLTQRSAVSGTDTYSYDSRNQITSYTRNGTTVSHVYDGVGRRVARTESGTETRFVLDTIVPLFRVLQETDDAGVVQASYVYGRGLIERIDTSDEAQVHHYDSRGSTIALSNLGGSVTDRIAYGPSGGSAPTSPFSRPAQRSLTFRPACSPSRPRRPSAPKASVVSSPPLPLRLLPAGATSCRVGLAPTEDRRLCTAH